MSFFTSTAVSVFADEKSELDSLESKHIVLMDYNSGKVLYEKDGESKIYPASTTKTWTAFCVLKKCKDLNEVIEIENMPTIEGSSMYLENGERFTVFQLLEALLIHSSNDVAFVLARHFGDGDAGNFIKFMNEEAAKYGATHTHFHNPHGLPDEEHYTTATDMVNLSRVAYGNDIIKKIVAMKEVDFKKSHDCKVDRQMFNSNKFLSSLDNIDYKGKKIPIKYDIVDGIKTGYTDDAGNCLVSTAQKNGERLICGIFGAPGGALYHDSRTVLDYGFDSFKTITVFNKKDLSGEKKVKFAKPSAIKYSVANSYTVTVPKDENVNKKDFKTKYNFSNLKLPVKKGDVIGTVSIFDNGSMVSTIGLIAENDSQSYLQYVMSLLPFSKDKKEDKKKDDKNKDEKKSEEKKDDKKEEKSKEDSSADEKSEEKKDSKSDDKSYVEKAKTTASNSYNGFIGIFYGIGDFFSNLFSTDGIKNIEKSNFYKFLEKKISSSIDFVPAKVIIFGVPILILLIILILIIGIIKDNFKKKKKKKAEKKKAKKDGKSKKGGKSKKDSKSKKVKKKKTASSKSNETVNIKKDETAEKKEMSVSDIVSKEDAAKSDNIDQETKRIPVSKDDEE